jgi:hypothetical protein
MHFSKSLTVLCLSSFVVSHALKAQDHYDALRYSYTSPMGTARSMGFGNALGSVGGDFATLSVNPAGIGIYRTSEVMFTPSLKFSSVQSSYLGATNTDQHTRFNLNNLGIVFTYAQKGNRYDKSNWKAVSVGLGFNRIADFSRNYYYNGLMKGDGDNYSSFSEIFVDDANLYNNVTTPGNLGYLGYQSYLVDYDPNYNSYFTYADWRTGLNQKRSMEERGGINEVVLSLGGNYKEKLMLGATLGIPVIRYKRDAYFQEDDASGDPNNSFHSFRYSERLNTSGVGANLKLGAIYKPSDYFRAGVAIHTPTIYGMSDIFNESLTANTEAYAGITTVSNPENRFNYTLFTPWKGIISATAMLGKYGFITVDYEFVDYSSARFRFQNNYRENERVRNQDIRKNYQSASNFRVGIEGKLDNFLLRGGFGYYGSPYSSQPNGSRYDYSAGAGYRYNSFFADIAWVQSVGDSYEKPYTLLPPVTTPTATLSGKRSQMVITVGWKM